MALIINKETDKISETIGLTLQKANQIRAMFMVGAYITMKSLDEAKAKMSGEVIFNDTLEFVLSKIDQTNASECIYLGVKLLEFSEEIQDMSIVGVYRLVNSLDNSRFEDSDSLINAVANTLKVY